MIVDGHATSSLQSCITQLCLFMHSKDHDAQFITNAYSIQSVFVTLHERLVFHIPPSFVRANKQNCRSISLLLPPCEDTQSMPIIFFPQPLQLGMTDELPSLGSIDRLIQYSSANELMVHLCSPMQSGKDWLHELEKHQGFVTFIITI